MFEFVFKKVHDIALIVPATQKSSEVFSLLDSIKKQSYPTSRYSLHVITDCKDDPVIGTVRAMDGKVFLADSDCDERDAVSGCLTELIKSGRKFDTFLVLDADSVLPYDYLANVNDTLNSSRQDVRYASGFSAESAVGMQLN